MSPRPRRLIAALLALAALVLGATPRGPAVPALVFVSRKPVAGRADLVPGLGPEGRAAAPGGRLMVRDAAGRVRELLPRGRFHDVSDPAVSWDGRRVAFAATAAPDSGWRIWTVGADGRGLRAVTRGGGAEVRGEGTAARARARVDDLDPAWLPGGHLVFASTRHAMIAQEGRLPVTNLWVVKPDGTGLMRVTSERNGGEEPSIDPRNGRVIYARWWTNRWLASERERGGLTLARAVAVASDTVDLWQAASIMPDGEQLKLAGGDPRTRATTSAYQPALLADGTLVGVRAPALSLLAPHGRPFLQIFRGGFAEPIFLGGRDSAACSPAALPSGGFVLSLDPRGRGDYGLWAARADGRGLRKLVDLPGTLELDAAILAPRARPPVLPLRTVPPDSLPVAGEGRLHDHAHTFRFDCLNVFANGPLDQPFPEAVPMQRGARIRFFAALSRPGNEGGDTVVLVRESEVTPWGGVHEDDMPADVPMFEQLVDAEGRVLRSTMGPAHVAGLNFAPFGGGTKCVGCHVGHSALEVPSTYSDGRWTNATPSAQIEASSSDPSGGGPRAIADRRTRGSPREVAWVATGSVGQFLRLRWRWPIEVKEMVLYPLAPSPAKGTDLQILEAELVFSKAGREVERTVLKGPLSPRGTRTPCNGIAVDAVEIHFLRTAGHFERRPVAGLVEVETIARLVDH